MPYRLTRQAVDDLDEITDFIARRMQNPRGAKVVEDYLFEAFERIGRDPDRCGGKSMPELTRKPVKFLLTGKYFVIYDDRTNPVFILAIAGGRRDLPRLLAEDERFPVEDGEK